MKILIFQILLLLIGLISVSSCTLTGDENDDQSVGVENISCEVFYKKNGAQSLEAAPVITLTENNDEQVSTFQDLVFSAHYQVDEFKGRALYISVLDPDYGSEISRQLYQFDSKNPPENQFVGGHGFTGLNYIYHPISQSEMQYFCSVQLAR